MTGDAKPDHLDVSLTDVPPNSIQRRFAVAVILTFPVCTAVTALFATISVPQVNAFIPIIAAMMLLNDFITSALLFGQFSATKSPALLALANGYLFTSLIVIPFALSFPDAFSPGGLMGAGPSSTGWLYLFWHAGFPVAVSAYVWLGDKDKARKAMRISTSHAVGLSVAIIASLVFGLTWLATAGQRFLPPTFVDLTHFSPGTRYFLAVDGLISSLALLLLLRGRRRSLLDLCLIVVVCAWIAEIVMTSMVDNARFSLGFYVGRVFSLLTSAVVLAVLVSESTRLYTRLVHSNAALLRERSNKLMNMEAAVASISHEIRQPLSAVAMNAGAVRRFLERVPPDLNEVRSAASEIVRDSQRMGQILENIRELFGRAVRKKEPVDINETTLAALQILRAEINDHRVVTGVELTSGLPPVIGHRGQLQEVIMNLVHNAIEAMSKADLRMLKVRTGFAAGRAIILEIDDSGPGIDPQRLDEIFEPFVTTKAQGMGLGLAICRMIVERHGGQLAASSDGKSGARLLLRLPVEPHSEALPNSEPSLRPGFNR